MTDPGYEYTRAFSSGETTRGRSKLMRIVRRLQAKLYLDWNPVYMAQNFIAEHPRLTATSTALAAGLLAFVIVWLCISLAILAGT